MVIPKEWFQTTHLKFPRKIPANDPGKRQNSHPHTSVMICTLFLRQRKLSDMSCPVPFSLDSVHNESREAKAEYYISDVIVNNMQVNNSVSVSYTSTTSISPGTSYYLE